MKHKISLIFLAYTSSIHHWKAHTLITMNTFLFNCFVLYITIYKFTYQKSQKNKPSKVSRDSIIQFNFTKYILLCVMLCVSLLSIVIIIEYRALLHIFMII